MKVFTYSQARQRLSAVLDLARREKVVITRRGGDRFCLSRETPAKSPFAVSGARSRSHTPPDHRASFAEFAGVWSRAEARAFELAAGNLATADAEEETTE